MATVVVCDDDKAVRTAISALCEDIGLEVVAETDSGHDAAELVRRFDVDVLVLDLSLGDGSGEETLIILEREGAKAETIVFTAYATDPDKLLGLGARHVVEKPDFELLGDILSGLRRPGDRSGRPDDRRVASRTVDPAPKVWRSPAGVSTHQDLGHSLLTLEVGDAALVVTVVGLEAMEADIGPLLAADCRLAVAGVLRDELRVQDLLHEAPEVGGFVALLRGGDSRAAGAVWARLSSGVRREGLPGEIRGAASRVDSIGGKDAVDRAKGALLDASLKSPPFVSV
jgi:CheY-like chemotaxis protein